MSSKLSTSIEPKYQELRTITTSKPYRITPSTRHVEIDNSISSYHRPIKDKCVASNQNSTPSQNNYHRSNTIHSPHHINNIPSTKTTSHRKIDQLQHILPRHVNNKPSNYNQIASNSRTNATQHIHTRQLINRISSKS